MFSDLREEQLEEKQNIINDLVNKNNELQRCYESNLQLCKQQEQRINKLATVLEEIYSIAEDTRAELSNRNAHTRGNLRWIMDKIKAVI